MGSQMGEEISVPLLVHHQKKNGSEEEEEEELSLKRRVWEESCKLWEIVGPGMVSRICLNSMIVVSQAFVGHLGDLELAAFSIAGTVVIGFSFGLMLGMASALETLCGQAYGAKKYSKLGVYLQRSWFVLFLFAVLLLPLYFVATPILELVGQPKDLAAAAGQLSVWLIPLHFCFVLLLPQQRFLQCQRKNAFNAGVSVAALAIHVLISWLFVSRLRLGLVAAVLTLNISWWFVVLVQLVYIVGGGCPLSWTGFSMEAFADLWNFVKLSAASGVMLCLENWYYRILVVLAGNMENARIAVDALSICMNINSWELMIPLAFFAGTGVRVANELGAGNGKGARFATVVSVVTSAVIGLVFWVLIMALHDKFALIFTSSAEVLRAVDRLSILLAFTILLNSIQPVLSGVAVGSGWQALVAYVNIGSYYVIGVPLGLLLEWWFHLDVLGLWAGMIGGTAIQTLILFYLTVNCDWEKEANKTNQRLEHWTNPNDHKQKIDRTVA